LQSRRKIQKIEGGIVLWVDAKRAADASFIPDLRNKGLLIEQVSTGKAAVARLKDLKPHVIVVDAESLRTSGLRICQSIFQALDGKVPIILILNPDRPVAKDPSIRFTLKQPFTVRKLFNRIKALLPLDTSTMMKAGSIYLDLDRHIVTCEGKETHLTPRLSNLLRMLMEQPGIVIQREVLFQEIWNTTYVGDTRTLDVHISWLRRALEQNPRKPRFLKTIRGVGYRLDP
jgi:DNA-binding response OmpR family regulator